MRLRYFSGLLGLVGLAAAATVDFKATTRDIEVAHIPSLIKPGDIIVCQDTLNNGPCDHINAKDRCLALSDEVYHTVHSIYQSEGVICKYFDADCSATHPTVSLSSLNGPRMMQFDDVMGTHVGRVLCRDDWLSSPEEVKGSYRVVNKRDALHIADEAAVSAAVEFDTDTDSAAIDERASGWVAVCNDYEDGVAAGCAQIQALGTCMSIMGLVHNNFHAIVQDASVTCYYNSGDNCHPGQATLTVPAAPDQIFIKTAVPENRIGQLTSVSCHKPGTTFEWWNPGTVTLCGGANFTEPCQTVQALGDWGAQSPNCVSLAPGIANTVQSLVQRGGAYCRYYWDRCDDVHITGSILSFNGDKPVPKLRDSEAKNINRVQCSNKPLTDETWHWSNAAISGSEPVVRRADKPGGIFMTSDPGFSGASASGNAMKVCMRAPDQIYRHVRSLRQEAMSFCGYFNGADSCTDMVWTYRTGESWKQFDELEDARAFRTTHIYCVPNDSGESDDQLHERLSSSLRRSVSHRAVASEVPPEVAVDTAANGEPGDIFVSSEPLMHGVASSFNAMHVRVELPPQISRHLYSLIQAKWSYCFYYYTAEGRQIILWDHRSFDDIHYFQLTDFLALQVTHVACIENEKRGLLEPADKKSTPGRTARREAGKPSPGDVTVCEERYLTGHCQNINAWNTCAAIGPEVTKHVFSFVQFKGAFCGYLAGSDCTNRNDDLLQVIYTPDREHWQTEVDSSYALNLQKVYCSWLDSAWGDVKDEQTLKDIFLAQMAAELGLNPVDASRKPPSTQVGHAAPRSVAVPSSLREESVLVVCANRDFDYPCEEGRYDHCTNEPFDVHSINVRGGWQCLFFVDRNCGTSGGPPHYIGEKYVPIVMGDVWFSMQSFYCHVHPGPS